MKVLALIPARGGSKGIPDKNLKLLGGKTLIEHAVDCARGAKKIDCTAMTSDSIRILETIKHKDVELIHRPQDLARDESNVVLAIEHALKELGNYEVIVLLQPTSPLRTSKQLDEIISMFENDASLNAVISVVPMHDIHPARMYTLDTDLSMKPLTQFGETSRRQDLDPVFFRNGCFYAVKTEAFLREKTLMVANKKAYVMDVNWLANIDSPRDLLLAELLYNDFKNENTNNGV
ncbi:acylneuraminate cytidylyltransferase family protein [Gelidibacter japonicus]|uniref:acylneuraminate cytidylyltransferase family protein n=1 Tax=Gelidibacter japonicus TaxID=1962232 RepID=UPI0019665723|nr:acylneuraminate cytidylyltransferase family protein [Gelidibacter japonicus]